MDELRARVPLSDIVGKRVKLTRAGREFKGCCPFHKEKSPSFTVNDIKGFYHCFGCGAHGDSIGFLMSHENMTFMDAVEQLASLAGMQVPKPTPEEEQRFKRQASLYDLVEIAAKFYEAQLYKTENKKILRYLQERGLSSETIKGFHLGYASGDDSALKQEILKAGFKIQDMIDVGLFKISERNQSDIYPFFRDRVIFPVFDFHGRVVAFGGRVLPEAYGGPVGKSAPKYINSPETDIFHKGRMLYGLSRARKAIGDNEPVIVVEGYMDVIALSQAGFKAPVAPLGTALTEQQIETLWKVMPPENRRPILCFDGDAAGQRAASRALERVLPILKPDHSLGFAFLPKEHDPDSLIKTEGVAAMDRILKGAASLFDVLWLETASSRNLSEPEARAGMKSALERRVRQIADMTVQQFFMHEIGRRVNETFLSKPALKKDGLYVGRARGFVGKKQPPGLHTPYRPEVSRVAQVRPVGALERERGRILLALMILYPELYEDFGESLGRMRMKDTEYDFLRKALMELLGRENNLDYQAVKQHLSQSGHGRVLEAVFDDSLYLHAAFAKPGQPPEEIRQAWRDVWGSGMLRVSGKGEL